MAKVHITSEIMPLKKVMLHRPGRELLNLTPDTLEELLFDDIPYLKKAQDEHDAFAQVLKDAGVDVVYLEDLMADVLADEKVKEDFIDQYIKEADIHTTSYRNAIYEYLLSIHDLKALVLKTMDGINIDELEKRRTTSLYDLVTDKAKMIIAPMPNLYFTRDPFVIIGNGVCIDHMYSKTRRRETIYAEYIFDHHKDYKDTPRFYDRHDPFSIEGGDIIVLSKDTLAVGISQRTEPDAIELLANNIFKKSEDIKTILAIAIPKSRAFMHLDTVFTQVDYDKFTIHPMIEPLDIYRIVKKDTEIKIAKDDRNLRHVLMDVLKLDHLVLIKCGGSDTIAAMREQWNDGSNALCIAPGIIVCYERNDITNRILAENGLKVLTIPSSELSRGRGGPRCMSMPLIRDVVY